jgi:4-hydroxy-tetrahydrodipicolinate synthase
MTRKKTLRGMATIAITPFTDKGQLDEQSYRRELSHIVKSGITGVIAGAYISEGSQMPDRMLKRVWEITLDEVKGNIPIGFGTLHESVAGVTDLVKTAADMGADFTMTPPGRGPMTDEKVYEYYGRIASETDILIMLYDSAFYVPLSVPVVLKLTSEFSNICYVKAEITNSTVYYLAEAGVLSKADVLCGQEQYLLPHLQDGAVGGVNSISIVAPRLTGAVFNAAKEKNWTKAWTAFRELWPVMMALYNPANGVIPAFKEILYAMGIFDNVNVLTPRMKLSSEQKANLRKAVSEAGIELVR